MGLFGGSEMAERHVVVLSDDIRLRNEMAAVVADKPEVRTVFVDAQQARTWHLHRGDRVVIIDDETHADAVRLVGALKADEREAAIIYLAARHSIDLERQVRQAGATYYADKSAHRDLGRVIRTILRADHFESDTGIATATQGGKP